MARIRTVKPDFFRHEALYEAERASKLPLRLAFAGLWTVCDRDGRFRWQPRVLKLDCLPFDDVDFSKILDALAAHGFIARYEVSGVVYGHIPSWRKHQQINTREAESVIPAPDLADASTCTHRTGRVQGEGEGKGKGREGKEECGAVLCTAPPAPIPEILLPLVDGTEHGIAEPQIAEWRAAYPSVDVMQELREMRVWLSANPARRKTRRGISAFVVSWLAREQDKPRQASLAPLTSKKWWDVSNAVGMET